MKFAIVQYLDIKSEERSYLVQNVSNSLESFLKDKNYGNDVESILIGFLGVKTKEGYKDWYKEKKPKYIDYKQIKNKFTGLTMEIIKEYSYDIKFDNELYDEFVNETDELSKKLFVQKLLESLKNFDKLPKQVEDFDVKRFKEDLSNYLVTDLDSL